MASDDPHGQGIHKRPSIWSRNLGCKDCDHLPPSNLGCEVIDRLRSTQRVPKLLNPRQARKDDLKWAKLSPCQQNLLPYSIYSLRGI